MTLQHSGKCLHFARFGSHRCARIEHIAFDADAALLVVVVVERWGDTLRVTHDDPDMIHTVWTFETRDRLKLDGVAHANTAVSMALRKLDRTLRAWVTREAGAAVRAARKAGAQ